MTCNDCKVYFLGVKPAGGVWLLAGGTKEAAAGRQVVVFNGRWQDTKSCQSCQKFLLQPQGKTAALGVQMLWVSEESMSAGVKVLGSLYVCFSESRPILQAEVSQLQPGLWEAVLLLLQNQGSPPHSALLPPH